MAAERERRLVLALAASVVLHAIVLSMRPTLHPGSRPSPPLAVRLAAAEPQASASLTITRPEPRATSKAHAAAVAPRAQAAAADEPSEMTAPAVADAAAIARYRYDVIASALRYKRDVPSVAAEGDVAVRIGIRASGERALSVKASSGQPLVDAHALEMFRLALDEVGMPLALRGQDFAIEVRALYSRDQ